MPTHLSRLFFLIGLGAIGGCGGLDAFVSVPPDYLNRTFFLGIGQELRVVLGNVGPALYESPPRLSSTAISYVGVEVIPPFNPGGPTQQFRFRGDRSGETIITFRRLLGDSLVGTVSDTIEVR
jgi:hypothetical protein